MKTVRMRVEKRVLIIVLCCALLLPAMTGCRLAREDVGADASEDRLVGVFITMEYIDLFDMDRYIDDNLKPLASGEFTLDADTQGYEGRLYATIVSEPATNEAGEAIEEKEYVFKDIEGIPFFSYEMKGEGEGEEAPYIGSSIGEGISDAHINMEVSDEDATRTREVGEDGEAGNYPFPSAGEGEGNTAITMEGTIYVVPGRRGVSEDSYHINSVYQREDGSVYLTSGEGISMSGVDYEGLYLTETLENNYTTTVNGKAKTESFSIDISFDFMFAPEKIVFLQMDAGGKLLGRTEYAPDATPETFTPEKDAAYLIVETHKKDTKQRPRVSREIYSRNISGDASDNTEYGVDDAEDEEDGESEILSTYYANKDGICAKRETEIKW